MAKHKSSVEQSNNADADDHPPFEQLLAELQQIVADLEDGEQGLEESMQKFEVGTGLLKTCYNILAQAEQRIEILTGLDRDGNPVTEPFDSTATIDRAGRNKTASGRGHAAPAAGPSNDSAADNLDRANDSPDETGAADESADENRTLF